jgi:hypothetical protein
MKNLSQPDCAAVTERIALGEPLAELADHAASCADCRAITAMPAKLAAARHAVDPGLGFAARMTVGARQRLGVRRRQRIAGMITATALAGVAGIALVTRAPQDPQVATAPPAPAGERANPVELDDTDLATLVDLARSPRVLAKQRKSRWQRITRPLAPYMHLVNGVSP